MEMVLLGLFMIRDFTLYEIKKAMESTVDFFYKSSYGSIHPALKKLENKGFLNAKPDTSSPRKRTVYSITASGKNQHIAWLGTKISPSQHQDEGLLRLFFLDSLPKNSQLRVLQEYTKTIDEQITALTEILNTSRKIPVPKTKQRGFAFRMMVGEYGLQQMALELKFYKNVIKKLKQGKPL